MRLNELKPPGGSKHRRKIVGRGDGSGHGSYSGRGIKGQKARSGPGIHPYFEGGQLPLIRRLPQRRGFTNIFKVYYQVVNLKDLNRLPEEAITPEVLYLHGLINNPKEPVKILAEGEVSRPLMVNAHKFSQKAKEKITAAGGKAEVLKVER